MEREISIDKAKRRVNTRLIGKKRLGRRYYCLRSKVERFLGEDERVKDLLWQ